MVHNGVVENCERLKEKLLKSGHKFSSGTDTEVLAHLIGEYFQREAAENRDSSRLAQAVMDALREVIGTYGLVV